VVRNLNNICLMPDGAYLCYVDLWNKQIEEWELNVRYVARTGDTAPVNLWILEQIATGNYDPIVACEEED